MQSDGSERGMANSGTPIVAVGVEGYGVGVSDIGITVGIGVSIGYGVGYDVADGGVATVVEVGVFVGE